jgi:hypothetical protein
MHIHAAAETALLDALERRGFIDWDFPKGYAIGNSTFRHRGAPRINAAGFAAIDG